MITNFMRVMRKYRIRKDMIMKDMTDRLGIRLSELSAIESGVQPLTRSYVERLKAEFDFTEEELREIESCLKEEGIKVNYTLMTRNKAIFDYKSECGEEYEVTVERTSDGYEYTDPYFIDVPDDEHGDYADIVEEVFDKMNKQ